MDENTCPILQYGDENYYENICPANMTTGTTRLETTFLLFHIFFTIVPILFSVAFSIVASRKIKFSSDTWKFLLEFVIIIVPIILNVTVCNPYVELICVLLTIAVYFTFRTCNLTPLVDKGSVISLGPQPTALTLLRSTINIITAVCILAIDFSSFPRTFRKSATYGVGLMDTGIGLFVFSMGVVSRAPNSRRDFLKLSKIVGPVLVIGAARTVVIHIIDYNHDVTEYGKHMNAFFTLGLTKLIGGIVSALTAAEFQLLLLGILILIAHECLLLFGVADFVMDSATKRNTLFLANREGICSLPGFVGIYLISMYIARVVFSESTLLVDEYSKKVKRLTTITALIWVLLFVCVTMIGISRRVSNLGYVLWTLSIALTMLLFYIILYDYIFHTWKESEQCKLPILMEATNRNGLVFFLVANILTGCVNIFLRPGDRDAAISFTILCLYMLLSVGPVYLLLRMRIKIA